MTTLASLQLMDRALSTAALTRQMVKHSGSPSSTNNNPRRGHGNKFERISSNFNFEWTKFEFSKNRNKFESLCSNFEQTAVTIKRTSDISLIHLVPRGPLGPLLFPSC